MTAPCCYCPEDLPVGREVEVEDSDIDDPDPGSRLMCVFVSYFVTKLFLKITKKNRKKLIEKKI